MPLPNYSSQNVRATAPGRGAAPRVPTATFKGDVMNMGQGAPTQRLNIPQIDPATGRPSTFGLQPFPTGGISKMVPGVTYAPATQFNANDPNSPELQNRSTLFQAVLGQLDPSAGVPQTTIFPGSEGNPVPVNAGSAMGAPMPANPGIAAGPGVVQTQSFGQTGVAAPNVFPSLYPRARKAPPLYSQS